jgi:septum formation protein
MKKDFVYLASASPRRAELLRQLGVEFRVHPAELDERRHAGERPGAYVERLAAAKAAAVHEQLATAAPVVGADTVVVCAGEVLGKPADSASAIEMLARLSGRTHEVLSAVAVADGQSTQTRLSVSKVRFRPTTPPERAAYCATREPLDKAGAYGIQGFAAAFVEYLEGSYSGVMGLPLFETAELLAPFELPRWLRTHAKENRDES